MKISFNYSVIENNKSVNQIKILEIDDVKYANTLEFIKLHHKDVEGLSGFVEFIIDQYSISVETGKKSLAKKEKDKVERDKRAQEALDKAKKLEKEQKEFIEEMKITNEKNAKEHQEKIDKMIKDAVADKVNEILKTRDK